MNTISLPKDDQSISTHLLPAEYDVSIILNLHNEARYLKRTMRSLEEAVRYARQFDITFEIVVVLDNADAATAALMEGYDYSAFDAHRIMHVRNGSLGLSRNDGIEGARGEYIATADADDLVSFDYFQKLYMTAYSLGRKCVVFPEYYLAFGANNYVWKFHERRFVGNAVFFDGHPYGSRLLFHRSIWTRTRFADVSLKSGYAYEDWHFNCECLAAGCSIQIARDVVLFYRQRAGSLMRRADTETIRQIPESRYFEPNIYLKLTWGEFFRNAHPLPAPKPFYMEDFLDAPGMVEIVAAANRIEPAISMGILKHAPASSNLCRPEPAARAYFEACRLVAGQRFTDILLVPFMAKGGAEKYIISVLEALRELDGSSRILVIATQPFTRHEWLDKLPEGSIFLDLHALDVADLTPEALEKVTLRLIQHIPGVKRLHLKNCEFVDSFARKYLRCIPQIDTSFYHFCDPRVEVDGVHFVNGQSFDFVAEIGKNLTRAISDHEDNLAVLDRLVGKEYLPALVKIYNVCNLPENAIAAHRNPARRLLWAARIDAQKRPHLVKAIAERLSEKKIDVRIDAFGGTTYGVIGPDVFEGQPLLTYRGDYDGFASLPAHEYDAFLYTAGFDGLPNVILEAMAAGLPVMAANVGGIGEVVTPETGYLIEENAGEDALVEAYLETILALYSTWPAAVDKGMNGRRMIAERHSMEAYRARIADVFRETLPTPG